MNLFEGIGRLDLLVNVKAVLLAMLNLTDL